MGFPHRLGQGFRGGSHSFAALGYYTIYPRMIYHFASQALWQTAQATGHYAPESLATEGFIHCSTAAQVAPTANRYFGGQGALLLLHIDEARLVARLVYEASTGGHLYPHVYGPLNPAAVVQTSQLWPDGQGEYRFPL
jgi:uncharacterized protein (DUF952 family)